jgi:hypothetical protein
MAFLVRILCSALAALAALPCVAQGRTQLASNETGAGALIEQVLTQRTRSLYASLRTPSGAFGPLRPISAPYYYFADQQVAVDDAGGAVAIWSRIHSGGTPDPRVLAASRRPGGRFGRPRLLARDADYEPPLLAVNARGDAIVVWRRFERPSQYSFRPAGGGFSRPITIPGATGADAIALDDDGGAFLVWSSPKEDVEAAYRAPGGSFGAPQPVVGPPPGQVSRPGIATDREGDMLLVWHEGDALRGAERHAHAASFEAPFVVATGLNANDAVIASAVAPSGQAAVAYGRMPLKLTTQQAGIWTLPQQLPVGLQTEGFRLAMNRRGDAALTWASDDRAVHATYRPAGAAFGAQRKLSRPRPFAPGGYFVSPGLAIDGAGRATVTWEESDGRHVSVYARDFQARHARARVRVGRLPTFRREGPASDCRPSWGRVIRSSRQATVFVGTRGEENGRHYACLLARGAQISLYDDDGLFPPIALAGPLVGYAEDICDPDECETIVSVTDLRDDEEGVDRGAPAGPGGTSEVPALVLKGNGALAWVSCAAPSGPTFGTIGDCVLGSRTKKRVYAFDRRSFRPRLLDVSRRISPETLTLQGSRLTWRRNGKLQAARLR